MFLNKGENIYKHKRNVTKYTFKTADFFIILQKKSLNLAKAFA